MLFRDFHEFAKWVFAFHGYHNILTFIYDKRRPLIRDQKMELVPHWGILIIVVPKFLNW